MYHHWYRSRVFFDLYLFISNDIVSAKIYDKCDDFDFEVVNFQCVDGDSPRSTSYWVYFFSTHTICQSI